MDLDQLYYVLIRIVLYYVLFLYYVLCNPGGIVPDSKPPLRETSLADSSPPRLHERSWRDTAMEGDGRRSPVKVFSDSVHSCHLLDEVVARAEVAAATVDKEVWESLLRDADLRVRMDKASVPGLSRGT